MSERCEMCGTETENGHSGRDECIEVLAEATRVAHERIEELQRENLSFKVRIGELSAERDKHERAHSLLIQLANQHYQERDKLRDEVISVENERNLAIARAEALLNALDYYGRHEDNCNLENIPTEHSSDCTCQLCNVCSCGYHDGLALMEAK